LVAEQPAYAMIMTREFALLPKSDQQRIRQHRRRVHDAFVREYAAAQADGSFRPGNASVLVSLLLGAASWTPRWFRREGPMMPERLGTFAQEFLAPAYRVERVADGLRPAARPRSRNLVRKASQ
jgi:hypothetical protein